MNGELELFDSVNAHYANEMHLDVYDKATNQVIGYLFGPENNYSIFLGKVVEFKGKERMRYTEIKDGGCSLQEGLLCLAILNPYRQGVE